jgi:hypothetical protein
VRAPQACAQAVDLCWRRHERGRPDLALFVSENLVVPAAGVRFWLPEVSAALLPFANI